MEYTATNLMNTSGKHPEKRRQFYTEVVEKGRATLTADLKLDGIAHTEIECTVIDSKEKARQQYRIMGDGGFSTLLAATGQFSVRWDAQFPDKLFTFRVIG